MNDIQSSICSCGFPRPWTTYIWNNFWYLLIKIQKWLVVSKSKLHYLPVMMIPIDGHSRAYVWFTFAGVRGCWNMRKPPTIHQNMSIISDLHGLSPCGRNLRSIGLKTHHFPALVAEQKLRQSEGPMALSNHGKQQLDDALSTIEDVLGNLRRGDGKPSGCNGVASWGLWWECKLCKPQENLGIKMIKNGVSHIVHAKLPNMLFFGFHLGSYRGSNCIQLHPSLQTTRSRQTLLLHSGPLSSQVRFANCKPEWYALNSCIIAYIYTCVCDWIYIYISISMYL